MESIVCDEISHFLSELELRETQPFDVDKLLAQAISNTMTTVIFGTRFDYSDDRLEEMQFSEYAQLRIQATFLPIIKVEVVIIYGFI